MPQQIAILGLGSLLWEGCHETFYPASVRRRATRSAA